MATGIDTKTIISQLMAVEAIPQNQLKQRVSDLQTKQNAWSKIGSGLTALQTASDALAPIDSLSKLMKVTSSNDGAISARVVGTPSNSSANIDVLDLATTHSVVGADVFSDGNASAGGRDVTVVVNGQSTTFTSATGTIGGLVDAVNAGNSGVKAKLLQTNAGSYQMVLTAATSGAAAAFTASGSGWTSFAPATVGKDAHLKVDGVDVYRSSNTVNDVLSGVELTLKAPTTAAVQINVTRDDDSVVSKVKALVDAANSVLGTIKAAGSTSTTATSRGPLAGDSSLRQLGDQIRNVIANGITGADGVRRPASTLGVSLTKDGKLTFDETKLRASLTSDPTTMSAMLGRSGSSTVSGVTVSTVLAGAKPGTHSIAISQAASQSVLAGMPVPAPPPGTTVDMAVTTSSGTVHVSFAVGATTAETATNINIAMARGGLQLAASSNAGALTLTEKRFGPANTFSISGAASIGLDDGAATPGTNVVGTVDGKAVTGSGRSLFVDNGALSVVITPGQLASSGGTVSGTYTVNDGLAGAFSRLGAGATGTGMVPTANDSLTSQIKYLQDRISNYDEVLTRRQAVLTAKFTAMDTLVTQMQARMSQFTSSTTSSSG